MPKDLQVFYTDGEELKFASGDSPLLVEGLTSLVQEVLIELLSDVNTTLAQGSGIPGIIRQAYDDDLSVRTALTGAINTAKTHILSNQRSRVSVKANQALKDLQINDIFYDGGKWNISLTITNILGESADLVV